MQKHSRLLDGDGEEVSGMAEPSVDEQGYFCGEWGNGERFVRYSVPMVHKEIIDAEGNVIEDFGYVHDAEPDPEIRCGRDECDQVLVEGC